MMKIIKKDRAGNDKEKKITGRRRQERMTHMMRREDGEDEEEGYVGHFIFRSLFICPFY